MAITHAYHTTLDGNIPEGTHRVHFSDTWNGVVVEADVIWDGVTKPIPCDLSWTVWLDGHGYIAHPIGEHVIRAACYSASEVYLGTYTVIRYLTSTGTFTLNCNVGTGVGTTPPFELPVGYSGTYPFLQWQIKIYASDEPFWPIPPQGFYATWPDGYVNTLTFTGLCTSSDIEVWGGGSFTETPIYPFTEHPVTNFTVSSATVPGDYTVTIHGEDGEQIHELPLTLTVYDGYRWYLAGVNYTPLFETFSGVINYGAATHFHDILSGTGVHATNFQITPVAGWSFVDESANDLTAGLAIAQEMKVVRVIATPPDYTPGAYSYTVTVTDSSANTEVRTVDIPIVGASVVYPGGDGPGEFHFNVGLTSYSGCTMCITIEHGWWSGWTVQDINSGDYLAQNGNQAITYTVQTVSGSETAEFVATWNGLAPGDYTMNLLVWGTGNSASSATSIPGVIQTIPVTLTVS